MTSEAPERRLLEYGPDALLLECADLRDSQAMHRWLTDRQRPEIAELVPGARTVLIRLRDQLAVDFCRTMITVVPPQAAGSAARTVRIPTDYDGPDLAAVAGLLGIEAAEVIDWHTGQDWLVAFSGFAPGFGYLSATEQPLSVPRLDSPRTRVPAGSVALADTWSAVYPGASPGGWQLIGTSSVTLFDPQADPPALLAPGTRVRFVHRAGGDAPEGAP